MKKEAKIDIWCERLESGWNRASRRRQTWMFIGIYTVIFLVTAAFVFCQFIHGKKSFIGGDNDSTYTVYPALIYVGKWLREVFRNLLKGKIALKQFDISIGMGSDVIGVLNIYGFGDPLNAVSAVVPTAYAEYLFIALSLLRIYIAGLSFSYLCSYFNKRKLFTLIGSLVYCFCGYATQSAETWIYIINMMLQFPLMIVGVDKILKREKCYLFVFTVFYSALCGFYFFYMMTVLTAIYALVRFFSVVHTNRCAELAKAIGRAGLAYLLGIGLSAVILLPACIAYFESSRFGDNVTIPYGAFYTVQWYKNMFSNLFAPFSSFAEWNYQSFAVITLFAIAVLLCSKGKNTLKLLVLIGFALLLLPIGGRLMNGFAYPSNRWTFGLALLLSYVVVEELPELFELSGKKLWVCVGIACLYFVLAIGWEASNKNIMIGVVFAFLTLLILVLCHSIIQNTLLLSVKHKPAVYRCFAGALCLALVVANMGIFGVYEFSPDRGIFNGRFSEIGAPSASTVNNKMQLVQPYLHDGVDGRADFSAKASYRNLGMLYQVPAIPFYFSIFNGDVSEFWQKAEVPRMRHNFNLHNSDWRTLTSAVLSVKYYLTASNSTQYVPYGYELLDDSDADDVLVYENAYALPWGYTYDTTISYEELEAMNGLQKQEAMLQALALEDTIGNYSGEVQLDEQRTPYELKLNNCTWEDGILTVSNNNATATLSFDMLGNAECYLRLSGFFSSISEFEISVRCDNVQKTATIRPPTALREFRHEGYLFNLGYSEAERHELTITFPVKGTFQLDDIELYALPMDNYPERVEALREEPLENIQWGTNSLTGTVDLSKDKILCVSVPYSKGWTATVDGEEVEILKGNYMFMCLPLTAGHHDIEFHYCSPGIKLGAVLTVCSAGIVIWMLVRDKKKKKTA